MMLIDHLDEILATSSALAGLKPKAKAMFAARLDATEREYRAWTTSSDRLHQGERVTRGGMRRALKKAEKLANQLEETMNTSAIRHLTLTPKDGTPYDPSPVREQLRVARAFLDALDREDPPRSGHGGARRHGDVILHDLIDQLVRAYATATGRKPAVGVSAYTGKGSAVVSYVAACLKLLDVRYRSPIAVHNLIRRINSKKS